MYSMTMYGRSSALADVEDRDDVRIAGDARGGARLAREALARRVVGDVAAREQLHGDDAAERRVGRAIDVAHRAARDPLGVAVALGEDLCREVIASAFCYPARPPWQSAGSEGSVRDRKHLR